MNWRTRTKIFLSVVWRNSKPTRSQIFWSIFSFFLGLIFSQPITKWYCINEKKMTISGILVDRTTRANETRFFFINIYGTDDTCQVSTKGEFELTASISQLKSDCGMCTSLNIQNNLKLVIRDNLNHTYYPADLNIPSAVTISMINEGNIIQISDSDTLKYNSK